MHDRTFTRALPPGVRQTGVRDPLRCFEVTYACPALSQVRWQQSHPKRERLDAGHLGRRTVQSPAMAARATWKGFLKISLVNIPIKVFPATESSGTISFNQLHGECQTRIQQKRWCPQCNREVPNSEIVKG
jgi:hypothetical protein